MTSQTHKAAEAIYSTIDNVEENTLDGKNLVKSADSYQASKAQKAASYK